MKRIVVLIAAGVIVSAVVFGGYLLIRQAQNKNPANTNSTVVTGNTNETSVSTAPVAKGDLTVNKSLNYRGVDFSIDTALKTSTFHRLKAADGSTYIVLFLKPFSQTLPDDPLQWSSQDIRLVALSGNTYAPTEVSIPTLADVTGGYFWFTVPSDQKYFSLIFGAGAARQQLDLGI